jgi:hypothetical protein
MVVGDSGHILTSAREGGVSTRDAQTFGWSMRDIRVTYHTFSGRRVGASLQRTAPGLPTLRLGMPPPGARAVTLRTRSQSWSLAIPFIP